MNTTAAQRAGWDFATELAAWCADVRLLPGAHPHVRGSCPGSDPVHWRDTNRGRATGAPEQQLFCILALYFCLLVLLSFLGADFCVQALKPPGSSGLGWASACGTYGH
eukprot:1156673-Prymnesium_polylepis.1